MQKRIDSTISIQKVCRAMKNLAATRLLKTEQGAVRFRPFAANLEPIWKSDIDLSDQVKNVLLVPISTDRGLCGSINSETRKYIQNLIDKEYKPKKIDYSFLCFGTRLSKIFSSKNKVVDIFGHLDEKNPFPFQTTLDIVDRVFNNDKVKFDQMKIVYNFFASKQKYFVKSKDFYSKKIMMENSEQLQHYESDAMGVEDSINRDNLYNLSLATHIHQSIVESLASEQSSRMFIMDNAVKSCDDIIENLHIAMNMERQAQITTELTEITGSISAMKKDGTLTD